MASRPAFAPYLAALALFAAVGSIAACGDLGGQACTLRGCEHAVNVTIKDLPLGEADRLPITIEVCDGPACATTTVNPDGEVSPNGTTCIRYEDLQCCSSDPSWSPCIITSDAVKLTVKPDPARMAQPRPVHVTVKAGDGSVLLDTSPTVTPTAFYPNGPECDQAPCYHSEALLTVGGS